MWASALSRCSRSRLSLGGKLGLSEARGAELLEEMGAWAQIWCFLCAFAFSEAEVQRIYSQ